MRFTLVELLEMGAWISDEKGDWMMVFAAQPCKKQGSHGKYGLIRGNQLCQPSLLEAV
jgi:hypothetical protein